MTKPSNTTADYEAINLFEQNTIVDEYIVEAISKADGGVELATFSGPRAKERAAQYASVVYGPFADRTGTGDMSGA